MGETSDADQRTVDHLIARATGGQQQGSLDQATRFFKRALILLPGHGPALHGLGLIAQKKGNPTRALRYLARSAQAVIPGPPTAEVLTHYAAMLGNAQKHKKALAQADRALATDPHHAPAHHTRAVALEKLDRRDEAEVAYRAALAIDPALVPALAGLGSSLLKDHANPSKAAEALKLLTEARRLAPADDTVADKLGFALRMNGQFTAADKVYNLGVGTQAGDLPVAGDWNRWSRPSR